MSDNKNQCVLDYANKCDCREDDNCGCTFPNNCSQDFDCPDNDCGCGTGETAGSKETSDNENRLDGDEDSEEDDARPPDEIAFRLICSDCECQCINFDNRDNSAFPEFDCDDGECCTTLVTAENVFDCRF